MYEKIETDSFKDLFRDYLVYKNMSLRAFSEYRDLPLDSVKAWSCGARPIPSLYSIAKIFCDDEDWLREANELWKKLKDKKSRSAHTGSISKPIISSFDLVKIPPVIINEEDKIYLKEILPSGRTLRYIREYLKNPRDETDKVLKNNYAFTPDELDFHRSFLDQMHELAWNTCMEKEFWEDIIKCSSDYEFEHYSKAESGIETLNLLPKNLMIKFLNHYLSIKGCNRTIGYIKQFGNSSIRPTPLPYDNLYWQLTLDNLYELCKLAAGGKFAIAEWEAFEHERYVYKMHYDNTPDGLFNWAYSEHDAEHDWHFPYAYTQILNTLVYSNIVKSKKLEQPEPIKRKIKQFVQTAFNRNTGQEEKALYVYCRVISLTEEGQGYMSWYENNILKGMK